MTAVSGRPTRYRRFSAHLPSLAALAAFEAAARLQSFTKAAEELNLSQGAVSRQIRSLEERLGFPLFERVRQRVVLTTAGAAYAGEIGEPLERLSHLTLDSVSRYRDRTSLALATLPTFATRWLIPRLGEFTAANPTIRLDITTRLRPFDFNVERIDAAIHFGSPLWPEATLHELMGEVLQPVGSPALIRGLDLRVPEDALRAPLIQLGTRRGAWLEWLTREGLDPSRAVNGPHFDEFAMVARAAVEGLGLAILPVFLLQDEITRGALEVVFDRPVISPHSYYLVYPEQKTAYWPLACFRDWLLQVIAREQQVFANERAEPHPV
jgi:LysR family glycine cleavage system transcriptional activator